MNLENDVAPVVNSVDEAIARYLNTCLDVLVADSCAILAKDQPLNETLRGFHAVLAIAIKGMTWTHK